MGNGTILIFEKNGRVSEILVRAARKAGFSVKMCHPRDIALDLREYAGTFV